MLKSSTRKVRSLKTLAWAIIAYGFAASTLPVWLLLAPRDYLSTFVKLGTIGALAVGIVAMRPEIQLPAVTRFAPNFRSSILGRRILSPLDLEREFGLAGGDIFHGKLSLNQLFSPAQHRPTQLDQLPSCSFTLHPAQRGTEVFVGQLAVALSSA